MKHLSGEDTEERQKAAETVLTRLREGKADDMKVVILCRYRDYAVSVVIEPELVKVEPVNDEGYFTRPMTVYQYEAGELV